MSSPPFTDLQGSPFTQSAPCPTCHTSIRPADDTPSIAYTPWGDRAHLVCLQAGLALDTAVARWLVVRLTPWMPDYLGGTSRLQRVVCRADDTPVLGLVAVGPADLRWQQANFGSGLLGGALSYPTLAAALEYACRLAAL